MSLELLPKKINAVPLYPVLRYQLFLILSAPLILAHFKKPKRNMLVLLRHLLFRTPLRQRLPHRLRVLLASLLSPLPVKV